MFSGLFFWKTHAFFNSFAGQINSDEGSPRFPPVFTFGHDRGYVNCCKVGDIYDLCPIRKPSFCTMLASFGDCRATCRYCEFLLTAHKMIGASEVVFPCGWRLQIFHAQIYVYIYRGTHWVRLGYARTPYTIIPHHRMLQATQRAQHAHTARLRHTQINDFRFHRQCAWTPYTGTRYVSIISFIVAV